MAQAGMGSFYSWFALGTLHEALGDQSEAVRNYKTAITSARGFYAPPLVRLTQLLVRNDDVEKAEAFLLGILPSTKRADALRALGEVFLSEGHPERAQRLLEQALAMTPETHAIRVTIAHCHLASGDPDTALAVLDQVPSSSESHPFACGKRVLVGLAADRPEAARQGIADIGAVGDGLYATAWTLVLDAREGRLPEGTPDADPDQITAVVFDMAAALLELRNLDAFNAMVPLLYAVATPSSSLDERLGHLLLRHGFADPAADRLLAAVRDGSARPETYAALGLICDHKELAEDAEVFYREALDRDQEGIGRYLDLAGHLAGQGRYEEANDVLRAGQASWPHSTVLRELSQSMRVIAGASAN